MQGEPKEFAGVFQGVARGLRDKTSKNKKVDARTSKGIKLRNNITSKARSESIIQVLKSFDENLFSTFCPLDVFSLSTF